MHYRYAARIVMPVVDAGGVRTNMTYDPSPATLKRFEEEIAADEPVVVEIARTDRDARGAGPGR